MEARDIVLANHKNSAKLSWKRKQAISMVSAIHEYFEDIGYPLPSSSRALFGKKFKKTAIVRNTAIQKGKGQYLDEVKRQKADHDAQAIQKALEYFTDKETGECKYDDLIELARAFYILRYALPAQWSIFKSPEGKQEKQLVSAFHTGHRLDPIWNLKKSQLIRGIWYRFLQETKIHEMYQPMHLMLTVPHKDGTWQGKRFYAREFIKKFNQLRKMPGWKRCIYGGEYGIEVTRKGSSGLHIHMHCLVFQYRQAGMDMRNKNQRDLVNRYIRIMWRKLTGSTITWYETLYVHRKDENGKFIMEKTADGIPFLDRAGQYEKEDEPGIYDLNTELIRGRKKKFYLDQREEWFQNLTAEEQLKYFCDGVMECIKYHFKTDCFKTKDGRWDVELMREVLQHSRYLRMYSKFGEFYREKRLNYSRLEKDIPADDMTALADEGVNIKTDGIEGRVINPFTGEPAKKGEYINVLAVPDALTYIKDKKGTAIAPVARSDQDKYFRVRDDVDIGTLKLAVMANRYEQVLIEEDLHRLRDRGWQTKQLIL